MASTTAPTDAAFPPRAAIVREVGWLVAGAAVALVGTLLFDEVAAQQLLVLERWSAVAPFFALALLRGAARIARLAMRGGEDAARGLFSAAVGAGATLWLPRADSTWAWYLTRQFDLDPLHTPLRLLWLVAAASAALVGIAAMAGLVRSGGDARASVRRASGRELSWLLAAAAATWSLGALCHGPGWFLESAWTFIAPYSLVTHDTYGDFAALFFAIHVLRTAVRARRAASGCDAAQAVTTIASAVVAALGAIWFGMAPQRQWSGPSLLAGLAALAAIAVAVRAAQRLAALRHARS